MGEIPGKRQMNHDLPMVLYGFIWFYMVLYGFTYHDFDIIQKTWLSHQLLGL